MPRTTRFRYPVLLEDDESGAVNVSFPDLPEALTFGHGREDALAQAADCLEEALANRVVEDIEIPPASPARGRPLVAPGAVIAAKVVVNRAMAREGVGNIALAARLGVGENEVRRIRDFRHDTKIDQLEAALAALGWTVDIAFRAA